MPRIFIIITKPSLRGVDIIGCYQSRDEKDIPPKRWNHGVSSLCMYVLLYSKSVKVMQHCRDSFTSGWSVHSRSPIPIQRVTYRAVRLCLSMAFFSRFLFPQFVCSNPQVVCRDELMHGNGVCMSTKQRDGLAKRIGPANLYYPCM